MPPGLADPQRIEAINACSMGIQAAVFEATSLGFDVEEVSEPIDVTFEASNTYWLCTPKNGLDVLDRATEHYKNGSEIAIVPTEPLSVWLDQQPSNAGSIEPVVVADARLSRGHGKYLVDQIDQLGRLYMFAMDYPELAERLEVRPFFETPDEHHYTSYRLLATAVGTVIAASLIYSGHTKGARTVDDWHRAGELDTSGQRLKWLLEDEASPYRLDAEDIRSNLAVGGRCIPLVGEGVSQSASEDETRLLVAHGIDPTRIAVPSHIKEMAQFVGATIGRECELMVGVDIVQTCEGGVVLDINVDPDIQTYKLCHLNGVTSQEEAHKAARMHALTDLVNKAGGLGEQ